MNRRDGILTSTASDHPVAPFSRRYRGCNADLPAAQECQTCGVSDVSSDHASPDLYPVILPPFAAGAWAMFLTLYLAGTHRFKGRFLALDLTTRTLSLLARLVGVTVALASVWASHGAWVDGMDLCQRGVHAPIKLRTQHAGWYVGLLANGLAFLSGAFAVFFGRGNLLGPTGNQLTMSAIDARQFDAITPTVGPYQVGTTPRGERVMRTPRPASFSEAYRSNRGAFTRRDQEDEAIAMTARDYGVDDVEAGGVGGAGWHDSSRGRVYTSAREAGRRGGGARSARASAPAHVAPPADGKRGWDEFKARFWRSRPATSPTEGRGSTQRRTDTNQSDERYVAERNQRVGRLGNILGRFTPAPRLQDDPDRSTRSDRSDDSAEAAGGGKPRSHRGVRAGGIGGTGGGAPARPSVPPPRTAPVFQFSNPLASGDDADADAPSAPPAEMTEPPADFEWNPLRDPYSITPSKGRGGSAAMSPPQPDRRARMERARAANEAAARRLEEGQDLVGMSLRERMEMQRREREREGR